MHISDERDAQFFLLHDPADLGQGLHIIVSGDGQSDQFASGVDERLNLSHSLDGFFGVDAEHALHADGKISANAQLADKYWRCGSALIARLCHAVFFRVFAGF
ncbi:MAG: hypothetical protein ACD_62C00045G0009 [uncultured bacterium]|nr:MAG: hypothetical protein ACD_62C00045G0009 [uncultured bacterium]